MKKVVALLVVALLVVGSFAGWLYARDRVQEDVHTSLSGLDVSVEPRTGATVRAQVRVTNGGYLAGTFEGLEGTLTVQGKEHPWTLSGVTPGTELGSGRSLDAIVTVQIPVGEAALVGITGVIAGGVEVRFDGALKVKVLGFLPVEVPIHDQTRVR